MQPRAPVPQYPLQVAKLSAMTANDDSVLDSSNSHIPSDQSSTPHYSQDFASSSLQQQSWTSFENPGALVLPRQDPSSSISTRNPDLSPDSASAMSDFSSIRTPLDVQTMGPPPLQDMYTGKYVTENNWATMTTNVSPSENDFSAGRNRPISGMSSNSYSPTARYYNNQPPLPSPHTTQSSRPQSSSSSQPVVHSQQHVFQVQPPLSNIPDARYQYQPPAQSSTSVANLPSQNINQSSGNDYYSAPSSSAQPYEPPKPTRPERPRLLIEQPVSFASQGASFAVTPTSAHPSPSLPRRTSSNYAENPSIQTGLAATPSQSQQYQQFYQQQYQQGEWSRRSSLATEATRSFSTQSYPNSPVYTTSGHQAQQYHTQRVERNQSQQLQQQQQPQQQQQIQLTQPQWQLPPSRPVQQVHHSAAQGQQGQQEPNSWSYQQDSRAAQPSVTLSAAVNVAVNVSPSVFTTAPQPTTQSHWNHSTNVNMNQNTSSNTWAQSQSYSQDHSRVTNQAPPPHYPVPQQRPTAQMGYPYSQHHAQSYQSQQPPPQPQSQPMFSFTVGSVPLPVAQQQQQQQHPQYGYDSNAAFSQQSYPLSQPYSEAPPSYSLHAPTDRRLTQPHQFQQQPPSTSSSRKRSASPAVPASDLYPSASFDAQSAAKRRRFTPSSTPLSEGPELPETRARVAMWRQETFSATSAPASEATLVTAPAPPPARDVTTRSKKKEVASEVDAEGEDDEEEEDEEGSDDDYVDDGDDGEYDPKNEGKGGSRRARGSKRARGAAGGSRSTFRVNATPARTTRSKIQQTQAVPAPSTQTTPPRAPTKRGRPPHNTYNVGEVVPQRSKANPGN